MRTAESMIKNVILDMGNVLLNYDPQIPLDLYCDSREEKEMIRRELFEGPEWRLGDLGEISDPDRYDLVKSRVSEAYWPHLKKCCDSWYVCMEELEGARNFCDYVKRAGYGIYILSNASDAFYTYFPPFLPTDYFDGVVVSSDVHMVKPDREIFEYLLNKYGLKAEECLFIDDMQENVEGARAAGMQAFRFAGNYEEIKKKYSL